MNETHKLSDKKRQQLLENQSKILSSFQEILSDGLKTGKIKGKEIIINDKKFSPTINVGFSKGEYRLPFVDLILEDPLSDSRASEEIYHHTSLRGNEVAKRTYRLEPDNGYKINSVKKCLCFCVVAVRKNNAHQGLASTLIVGGDSLIIPRIKPLLPSDFQQVIGIMHPELHRSRTSDEIDTQYWSASVAGYSQLLEYQYNNEMHSYIKIFD